MWRLYGQNLISRDQLIEIARGLQTDHRRMLGQLIHVENELRERHARDFRYINEGVEDPKFLEPLVNGRGLAQGERDLRQLVGLPRK